MMRMHTWALRTKNSTPFCIPFICSLVMCLSFTPPPALNGDRIVLTLWFVTPPYCPSPLPYTRKRRFASDRHNSPVGFHSASFSIRSPRACLLYQVFMYISSGYPRGSCSFDGGDTTGSFLGPRGVSFFLFTSPSQNANRLGEYHSLYPCRPVRWVSPSPSLESSRLSCVSLLFMLRGECSFLLLQVGG